MGGPWSKGDGFGQFTGLPIVQLLLDGRTVRLLETLTFTEPSGRLWIAPKGWVVNGLSIPQAAWSFVGGPWDSRARLASIPHDVACDRKAEPWRDVHAMFRLACLAAGESQERADLMYEAVMAGGPRW